MFAKVNEFLRPRRADPPVNGGTASDQASGEQPRRRPVDIGWLLDTDQARFIWGEPKRVRTIEPGATHAKSLSHCPAYLDYEARMYEVPCPIDVRLGIRFDEQGVPALINRDGDQSSIRNKHLSKMVAIVAKAEWRDPRRPIVQLITPYIFVADEPVFMTQMPPVQHYQPESWPGLLIGGRMPIHIWPRQMMWAFEWWDMSKDLVLRRGDPWFYVRFETSDPTRPTRMFEAEMTSPLREHINGLSGVANYVDRTFSLFKVAEERRPPRLLERKLRAATAPEAPSACPVDHG